MSIDRPGSALRRGDRLPRPHDATGVVEKLRDYCLAPEHPTGRHKARVFRAVLGYEKCDAPDLAASLVAALIRGAPVEEVRDNQPFGILCDVRILADGIRARRGRRAPIVTVWELRVPDAAPRLVTAYVDL